ncbi:MAG: GuaB3 family IMP dehydrogenase-related protein [Dehalococcoidales bacterium]|nr:GuaB3 family IMP dehydrogenase-related protein [Dehalococcoidales bacterium]
MPTAKTIKPQFKQLKQSYGFDEVAIVPGDVTVNPEQINIELKIGEVKLDIPILASAMDAVTDVNFAILLSKLGGLAVLHLEGVQTRYENPADVLNELANTPNDKVTALMQKIYTAPIKDNLIAERVRAIKKAGALCAAAALPANTKHMAPIVAEAGGDVMVVQATTITARHISKSYRGLIFSEICKQVKIPFVVGSCASYSATMELMENGVSGILVGVGPGAACTTREVTGVGVPQITATIDCAAARDVYFKKTGRYVSIITDGGFKKGADLCKAIAAGADGAMFGSIFAQAKEAPGKGYHWGMSTPNPALPRGTRIKVGTKAPLKQLLFGPTSVTDGTENFIGALRTAMGFCGASDIAEFHNAEMVIAPSITTEGKFWQLTTGRA